MTISLWRFSHLALAIVSSLFLIVAASTGIILSFEPIANRSQSFSDSSNDNLPIATVIDTLRGNYLEVISIERDKNNFFKAEVITDDGSLETFYIDLATGKKTGEVIEQTAFFEFITTLHRSLFLDTLGRFMIGVCATLLFLLAISGSILIIQRQRSLKSFFTKVENANFYQYSHISLGRILIIPILIISITGSYLFLQRFGILAEEVPLNHTPKISSNNTNHLPLNSIPVYNSTKVSDIRSIEFPFSPDEEDYFLVKKFDQEIIIHQYTGEILSTKNYPFPTLIARLSLNLHTGQSNSVWAIVLMFTSLGILYFIFSGFAMTFKRSKQKLNNKFSANSNEIVILFGSENGSTKEKAIAVFETLMKDGKKVFIGHLNDYQTFESMQHLLILTSTHGLGDAPANASKFIEKFESTPLTRPFNFSIVGFGSHTYPDFCRFASSCEETISTLPQAQKWLDTSKIHNQSEVQFQSWWNQWAKKMEITTPLVFSANKPKATQLSFHVINRSEASEASGESFKIELQPTTKCHFQSGDLLAITPPSETTQRLYSIGKLTNGNILLSIKKHEFGSCSNYLHSLQTGEKIDAELKINSHFHLEKRFKNNMFIANGTGIAPFLGMLNETKNSTSIVYWGGRTEQSFSLYKSMINDHLETKQLTTLKVAYSRNDTKSEYVWNLIEQDAEIIAHHLKNRGCIYICGSVAMEKDVLKTLENICETHLSKSVSYYKTRGLIRTDCY